MTKPTRQQIASDYRLWCEYVDADGVYTEQEFYCLPMESRLAFMDECFGPETSSDAE